MQPTLPILNQSILAQADQLRTEATSGSLPTLIALLQRGDDEPNNPRNARNYYVNYASKFLKEARPKDLSIPNLTSIYDCVRILYKDTSVPKILESLRNAAQGQAPNLKKRVAKVLTPSIADYNSLRARAEKALSARAEVVKQYDAEPVFEFVYNCSKYMFGQSDAKKLVQNIVLVMVTTGARLIEVLRVSQFDQVPNAPRLVSVTGFAKKSSSYTGSVTKPLVVITYLRLQEAVEYVRLSLASEEGRTNKQVSSKYGKAVQRFTHQFAFLPKTTAHDFRRLYAQLSFVEFAPKSTSLQAWTKKVLNHESLMTSINYNAPIRLHIEELDLTQLKSKLLEHSAELTTIEDKLDAIETPPPAPVPKLVSSDPNRAVFQTPSGLVEVFKLDPVPSHRITLEQQLERNKAINLKLQELKDKQVPVTISNLRKLGIGTKLASKIVAAGGTL